MHYCTRSVGTKCSIGHGRKVTLYVGYTQLQIVLAGGGGGGRAWSTGTICRILDFNTCIYTNALINCEQSLTARTCDRLTVVVSG